LREAQPPSGGCVLKPHHTAAPIPRRPAAFGRLCIETTTTLNTGEMTDSRLRAAVY